MQSTENAKNKYLPDNRKISSCPIHTGEQIDSLVRKASVDASGTLRFKIDLYSLPDVTSCPPMQLLYFCISPIINHFCISETFSLSCGVSIFPPDGVNPPYPVVDIMVYNKHESLQSHEGERDMDKTSCGAYILFRDMHSVIGYAEALYSLDDTCISYLYRERNGYGMLLYVSDRNLLFLAEEFGEIFPFLPDNMPECLIGDGCALQKLKNI